MKSIISVSLLCVIVAIIFLRNYHCLGDQYITPTPFKLLDIRVFMDILVPVPRKACRNLPASDFHDQYKKLNKNLIMSHSHNLV